MNYPTKIIYVGDPLCSWCYGYSEELEKLIAHFSEIEFQIVVGGLRPHTKTPMEPKMKDFLRTHWKDVNERSGLPFSYDILAPEKPDNQTLFTSNFTMPEPSVSRSERSENVWESANYFYANKDYDQAIEQFNILLNDSTFKRKSLIYLMKGVSQLAEGDAEASQESFDQISQASIEWPQSIWYKGLAHLKLEQTEDARKNFEILVKEGEVNFSEKAGKLLKQI